MRSLALWLLVVLTLGGCDGCSSSTSNALENGEACEQAEDCQSEFCVDGVCCESACDGLCESCHQAVSPGACLPVPADPPATEECTGSGACRGYCDGSGACAYPGSDTACGDPECGGVCDGAGECGGWASTETVCGLSQCNGDSLEVHLCDGAGACGTDVSTTDCTPYSCDPQALACHAGDCSGAEICAAGHVCGSDNTCVLPPRIISVSLDPDCSDTETPVLFSAEVTGEIDTFEWSFGDGQTSSDPESQHQYAEPGVFDVTLTVTGPGGQDTYDGTGMVEIVPVGWQEFFPMPWLGGIVDIWRSPDPMVIYAATSVGQVLSYNGTDWDVRDTPTMGLSRIEGFGAAAMAYSYTVVVATLDGVSWFDADPDEQLPRTTNYYLETFGWQDIHMISETQALLLIHYQNLTGTSRVDLWHYDAAAGEQDPSQRWFWLQASGSPPLSARELDPAPDQRSLLFTTGDENLLHTVEPVDPNDWRAGVEWKSYSRDMYYYADYVIPVSTQTVWLSYYDAIVRATWDEGQQTYLPSDFTPAELSDIRIRSMELSVDPQNPPEIWFTSIEGYSPQPQVMKLFKISDLESADPAFTSVESTGLKTSSQPRLGVHSSSDVIYGAEFGYLARWEGSGWNTEIDVPAVGWPTGGEVTPDGRVLLAIIGLESKIMVHQDGAWSVSDVSGLHASWRIQPRDILAAADDDLWAVGDYGLILHSTGGPWELVAHPDWPDQYMNLNRIREVPDAGLWVLGRGESGAVVLHNTGDGNWQHVEELESQMNYAPNHVFGSGPLDVYVLGGLPGEFLHYDGESWSRVDTGLFTFPEILLGNMQVPLTPSDPEFGAVRSACSGTSEQIVHGAALSDGQALAISVPIDLNWTEYSPDGSGSCGSRSTTERPWSPIRFNGTDWERLNYYRDDAFPMNLTAIDPEHIYLVASIIDPPEGASSREIGRWNGSEWAALPDQFTPDMQVPFEIFGREPTNLFATTFPDAYILNLRSCDP
jgi:PKD repeat protein